MENLINIERAISHNRRITFTKAKNKDLYYITSFGEEFKIPINKVKKEGIKRNVLAIDYVVFMEEHNTKINE